MVEFATLIDYDKLSRYVSSTFSDPSSRKLAVSLYAGGQSVTVALQNPGGITRRDASLTVAAACVTQLFTASLVLLAVRDGRLSLDDELTSLLPLARHSRQRSAFDGITVRHLLNHTHGLDGSRVLAIGVDADSRIDVDQLCKELSYNPPLSKPGELHCQNATGPYLSAAILEVLSDCRFEDILKRDLFLPLGISFQKDSNSRSAVCPAMGGSLQISIEDLQRFLIWSLRQSIRGAEGTESGALSAMFRQIVPVYGYRLEQGAGLGWKWFGEEWFGHIGTSGTNSAFVRIDIRSQVALAVVDASSSALHAMARLFGGLLPDLARARLPARLSGDALAKVAINAYVGWYDNAAVSVQLTSGGESKLEMHVYNRPDSLDTTAPAWSAALYPCTNGLFMMDTPPPGYNLFSDFSHPGSSGFEYFHNGSHVLRRRAQ